MAQEFIICVDHDEHMDTLVDRLNRLQGDFTFAMHVHQTWEVTACTWLRASNEYCDRQALVEAIKAHSSFKTLL